MQKSCKNFGTLASRGPEDHPLLLSSRLLFRERDTLYSAPSVNIYTEQMGQKVGRGEGGKINVYRVDKCFFARTYDCTNSCLKQWHVDQAKFAVPPRKWDAIAEGGDEEHKINLCNASLKHASPLRLSRMRLLTLQVRGELLTNPAIASYPS